MTLLLINSDLDIYRLKEPIVGDVGRVHLLERIIDLNKNENDHILDVGCGDCSLWKPFERKYLSNIWGIDRDKDKIFRAQKLIQERAIYGSVYELSKHFKKEYFDIVISTQVFSYIKRLKIVLKEINKALKPGGTLLFTIGMTKFNYSPFKQIKRRIAGYFSEKHYFRRYTDAELTILLKNTGFKINSARYYTIHPLKYIHNKLVSENNKNIIMKKWKEMEDELQNESSWIKNGKIHCLTLYMEAEKVI